MNKKLKIRNLTFQNEYSSSSCFLGVFRNCIINKRIDVCLWQIVKLRVALTHGVKVVVYWIYTTIMTSRRLFRRNPVSRGTNQPIRIRTVCEIWIIKDINQFSPLLFTLNFFSLGNLRACWCVDICLTWFVPATYFALSLEPMRRHCFARS